MEKYNNREEEKETIQQREKIFKAKRRLWEIKREGRERKRERVCVWGRETI